MSDQETLNQLTLFVGDSPAKTYPLPEIAQDWMESDQDFGLNFIEFYQSCARIGLLSRTSPAFSVPMKVKTFN